MRSMNDRNNNELCNKERAFTVDFKDEGSVDAGGPYNETISAICEELMSDFLPLFIPCPNNKHNLGLFRDTYIINP